MTHEKIPEGSYVMPRAEHARVSDAMRHELLKCPADASLREAARMMCFQHVHMIVITDPQDGSVLGTLSDSALLSGMLDMGALERPLGEFAGRSPDTISSEAALLDAAAVMRDRNCSHLLVRDAHSGQPVGVISTLDLAGVLAWGEA